MKDRVPTPARLGDGDPICDLGTCAREPGAAWRLAEIPAWRHSEDPLEVPCEVRLVDEPRVRGRLRSGDSLCEERFGEAHPQESLVGMR